MRENRMKAGQMILYEDQNIIVCRKPSGLPVQSAGIGTQDMMSLLMNYLSEKQQGVPYLGLIHRLDQPVEGILVFAKNKKAAAELSAQVSDGRMKKIYLAVCCKKADTDGREKKSIVSGSRNGSGVKAADKHMHNGSVKLVNYLKKDARTNTSAIVPQNTPGAKKSELIYEVLDVAEIGGREYKLVKIALLTGRHHQIRVQMAGAGMPLYGDRKYNQEWESFRLQQWEQGTGTQLALCAAALSFACPGKNKKSMEFEVKPSPGIFSIFDGMTGDRL